MLPAVEPVETNTPVVELVETTAQQRVRSPPRIRTTHHFSSTGGPPEGGPPGHPVLRFAESLSRGLDAVSGVAAWSMSPAEQAEALVVLRRQRARLAELELRVLAAADRNQVGAEAGAT